MFVFFQFSFEFFENSIVSKVFPEQYTDHLDEFKTNIEIIPLNNFDNYYLMPYIESQDYILAGYSDVYPVPVSHYVPIEKEKELRQGAEEEYSICQERGEYRDDPLFVVPINAEKPLAIDPVSAVRPNPSLRCYLSINAVTETSPEYSLIPAEIFRQAYEDYPGHFFSSNYMLCNK